MSITFLPCKFTIFLEYKFVMIFIFDSGEKKRFIYLLNRIYCKVKKMWAS